MPNPYKPVFTYQWVTGIESIFAMAGYSVFRHGTEVDLFKPELKLIKGLLPIALPSRSAISNTFVGGSFYFVIST